MVRNARGWGGLLVLLAVSAACAPTQAGAAAAASAMPPPQPSADTTIVSVTGTATVSLPADRARIQLAVETEGATSQAASEANARLMTAVLDAVRPRVGREGTVETTGYRLNPRYTRGPDNTSRISGYQALNQVVVTLAELDRVGPVLDAALEAGANRIASMSFFASDTEPARLEAIRLATAQARREADVIAEALGLRVVAPISVSTSGPVTPVFRGDVAMAMEARTATPVEEGSAQVTVTVNIQFRLGPGGSP